MIKGEDIEDEFEEDEEMDWMKERNFTSLFRRPLITIRLEY